MPEEPVAATDWTDDVWDLLDFILIVMAYPSATTSGDSVDMGLMELCENWASLGVPDDLSADLASQTIDALTDLETLLRAEPEQTSLFVRMQALDTISQMREALTAIAPAPADGGGA